MAGIACRRAVLSLLIFSLFLALPAFAQQTPPQTGAAQTPSLQGPSRQQPPAARGQDSLGDLARKLREKQRVKVKVTPQEAKQIFKAVDEITEFASHDSGLAQRTRVKRQLVGQNEIEGLVRAQTFSEEEKQERQRGLLAMKKFGLLPRDFDMEAFVVELMGESVAGLYDPKTKMVWLLNWVPLEEQKAVLAHELTHALQDQNFDLEKWHKTRKERAADASHAVVSSNTDAGESSSAGRCVTEGQAMVVMIDFLLVPSGIDLEHAPGLAERLQERMSYGSEGPVLHGAPLAIREGMNFPYREGLMFEIALLEKGSRQLAFTDAMQHPPRLTYEVLHPAAYIAHEKIAPVRIPDLRPVLGQSVRVQDTGVIGELDTRVFIHQYESKWLAGELSKSWRGASYATVALSPQGQPATTKDVGLLYVSRWQSPEAAERFAKFYAAAVARRYRNAAPAGDWKESAKPGEPMLAIQIATEEGPVIVEQWPGNLVFVSESFEAATSARLREAVLKAGARASAETQLSSDLTLRLAGSPELAPLRAAVQQSAVQAAVGAAHEAAKH